MGKELTGFPAKKRFFGGIFKGSFADSDSGEQRRSIIIIFFFLGFFLIFFNFLRLDLAKYINSAYQVCKEHNSAREKVVKLVNKIRKLKILIFLFLLLLILVLVC